MLIFTELKDFIAVVVVFVKHFWVCLIARNTFTVNGQTVQFATNLPNQLSPDPSNTLWTQTIRCVIEVQGCFWGQNNLYESGVKKLSDRVLANGDSMLQNWAQLPEKIFYENALTR